MVAEALKNEDGLRPPGRYFLGRVDGKLVFSEIDASVADAGIQTPTTRRIIKLP